MAQGGGGGGGGGPDAADEAEGPEGAEGSEGPGGAAPADAAEEGAEVQGVEALVLEMKDTSELMVDLAYTSLLFDSEPIARAVYDLEEQIDGLLHEVQRRGVEAVRDGTMTADRALVMIRLAQATEVISDSAEEIANVVLRDIPLHPVLRKSVEESDVAIASVDVADGARLAGRTLGEVRLASETGMTVIAVQRGREWVYGPGRDTLIGAGDRLFARGPVEGVEVLEGWCGSTGTTGGDG